jgi:hypothetical protein
MPRQVRSPMSKTRKTVSWAGSIPLALHSASVLVLDDRATRLELADRHQDALEQIERLEAGDHDRDVVSLGDRLVLRPAHDGADVAGGEERLDLARRRLEDRGHRRRHQDVADQDGEVVQTEPGGLGNGHGVGRRRRLEADGEEDDLPVRICGRDPHRVQRRVDDPHIGAAGLEREQVRRGAGDAEHVAVAGEDDVGPGRDRESLVDLLERRDADGQPGPWIIRTPFGSASSMPCLTSVWVWPPQTSINAHGRVVMRWISSTSLRATSRIAVLVDVLHERRLPRAPESRRRR